MVAILPPPGIREKKSPMLPMIHSADWIPDSFQRIESLAIEYLSVEIIEQWILSEQVDTVERILLSLTEQISILEASVFELIDSVELIRELLGNENKVQYDQYWRVVLSNDLLYQNMRIVIQIQNTILWISFLNKMAQISAPEIRKFFDECSQQLVRWGQGWYAPSDRVKDLDGLIDHLVVLQESITHLTRTKARIGDLLRNGFSSKT
jgi:hypothetical protein